MTNAIAKTAAAFIAAIAVTTAASAQDATIEGRIDLTQQIAASTQQTENKIFELVMNKAEAKVAADLAALNHTATPVPDAIAASEDVIVADIWF